MTTMASQITSLTVVNSTVYAVADQRKQQISASLAFVWGIHRYRWIPRTKGQLRRNVWWRQSVDVVLRSAQNQRVWGICLEIMHSPPSNDNLFTRYSYWGRQDDTDAFLPYSQCVLLPQHTNLHLHLNLWLTSWLFIATNSHKCQLEWRHMIRQDFIVIDLLHSLQRKIVSWIFGLPGNITASSRCAVVVIIIYNVQMLCEFTLQGIGWRFDAYNPSCWPRNKVNAYGHITLCSCTSSIWNLIYYHLYSILPVLLDLL